MMKKKTNLEISKVSVCTIYATHRLVVFWLVVSDLAHHVSALLNHSSIWAWKL